MRCRYCKPLLTGPGWLESDDPADIAAVEKRPSVFPNQAESRYTCLNISGMGLGK